MFLNLVRFDFRLIQWNLALAFAHFVRWRCILIIITDFRVLCWTNLFSSRSVSSLSSCAKSTSHWLLIIPSMIRVSDWFFIRSLHHMLLNDLLLSLYLRLLLLKKLFIFKLSIRFLIFFEIKLRGNKLRNWLCITCIYCICNLNHQCRTVIETSHVIPLLYFWSVLLECLTIFLNMRNVDLLFIVYHTFVLVLIIKSDWNLLELWTISCRLIRLFKNWYFILSLLLISLKDWHL